MKNKKPFPNGLGSVKIKPIRTPESLHLAVSQGAEPKLSYLLLYSCLGISALF